MSGELLWDAREDWREATALGRFAAAVGRAGSYEELHRWSVEDLEGFWRAVWEAAGLGDPGGPALADDAMPGARWFPGASVNYAERALAAPGEVLALSQTRAPVRLGPDELRAQVARCATGLRALGVARDDRVVAYLPNGPEALVGLLATASIGAIWSSCPPEFGTRGVIDRFAQIEPKVLLACDGYVYGTKRVDRRGDVAAIAAALPTLEHVVHVPYLRGEEADEDGWAALLAEEGPLRPERVPFDHPLYVLYSSGTTGLPKPIVHGHGAMLVEHWKALALHHDLGPADRFFWFSTTGWMMWNYLVSGLLVGASVVLFDGDPGHPGPDALWALAAEHGVTYLGVGAPLLIAGMRKGLRPAEAHDLSRLRAIGSTGSPLSPEGFLWVRDAVGVPVHSASGGTDVCSAFLGAAAAVPVWSGELSCRMLGADVRAFGPDGRELPAGEIGELVIVRPMPSMPVAFWGDEDGSRLRAAYFEDFPGAWRHGDWVTITDRGSCVIHGRSDATLNRGGVRLGTAELYGVVEALPEVADSLVVHLPGGDLGELVLFVVTDPAHPLDDELVARIRASLRRELSPRHVPDRVEAVPAVPRTLSGKKCEVPVKRILLGAEVTEVVNPSSLQDPSALDAFAAMAVR